MYSCWMLCVFFFDKSTHHSSCNRMSYFDSKSIVLVNLLDAMFWFHEEKFDISFIKVLLIPKLDFSLMKADLVIVGIEISLRFFWYQPSCLGSWEIWLKQEWTLPGTQVLGRWLCCCSILPGIIFWTYIIGIWLWHWYMVVYVTLHQYNLPKKKKVTSVTAVHLLWLGLVWWSRGAQSQSQTGS